MKKTYWIICILTFSTIQLHAQELSARQIIQQVCDVMNQEQSQAIMELTITTSSGDKRTFVYESYSKDRGEKNLLKYLEPSRVKGQVILLLNNAADMYTYFPQTNRIRQVASHTKKQKFEGSDFAYEDMGSGDCFLNDFSHKKLANVKTQGKDCWQIELTPNPDYKSSYSRLIIKIDKSNFVITTIDYFDEKDPQYPIKRLMVQEVRIIQGIPTPTVMVMKSLEDNTETIMKISSIDYNVDLPDEMFSELGMQQI